MPTKTLFKLEPFFLTILKQRLDLRIELSNSNLNNLIMIRVIGQLFDFDVSKVFSIKLVFLGLGYVSTYNSIYPISTN
jgi:hypothetical protein